MQHFLFPMKHLRITQGELSSYSHAGSLAMDFGGKDSGVDKLYAPCDMIVKRCRANATGEMYLESVDPVLFADGTTDYARLLCMHDGSFNKKVGDIVKQGEYFYDEGGMGSGNPNKFATHVHIEAGKGKWKSTTQSPNSYGTYVCERQSSLYKLFFIGEDVTVLDDGDYPWVRLKSEVAFSQYEELLSEYNELKKAYASEVEHKNAYKEQLNAAINDNSVILEENAALKLKLQKIADLVM